jgi:hypothetical protein
MRFMLEEGILMVWLDEKDWLELAANTGLPLTSGLSFATEYVASRLAIQRSLLQLAELRCPVEDQNAVRLATAELSRTGQPFASILLLTKSQSDDPLRYLRSQE